MKKITLFFLLLIVLANINTQAQKSKGIDFYVLPMLLGEYGAQLELGNDKSALGLHFVYYNPNLGLSGVAIRSQLGDGDELNLNTHGIIPGISYTYYPKGNLRGFYYGGLFRYKMAAGDVYYKDKYSGGTAYRGIVESDMNIQAINLNGMFGYRWVFENSFSLRIGASIGFQSAFVNDVTYNIVEEYDGDGDEVVDDLSDAIEQYTKNFTRPVTFQLMIAIGFTK